MKRPLVQLDAGIREMTEEEHGAYLQMQAATPSQVDQSTTPEADETPSGS